LCKKLQRSAAVAEIFVIIALSVNTVIVLCSLLEGRSMPKILQKLLFPVVMVFLATVLMMMSTAAPVCARSLEIYHVEIKAEVLPNGDLKVVEQRTINFNGQFRGADQKIYFNEIELYSEINIREGAHYYALVDQFPTSEPGTYAIRVFGEDYFMVDWSFDAYDEQRIFTLEYIARDAVVVHDDVAELYYKFVGEEWEFPAGSVRVTLTLPEGAADGEVLAWGHGPAHGEVKLESPEKIVWYVAPLAARTFLEGRAVFPRTLVSESTRFSGKEALDSIIAEEKRWATQSNINRAVKIYQPLYSLLLFIPVGLGLFSMWRKAANKGKVYQGDYYRDLPGSYPPEVAGYLWHKKKVQNESLAAGILDLARRGHLQIEPLQAQDSSGKAKKDDFQLTELQNEDIKGSVDKIVTDFLFGPVYREFNPESDEEKVAKVTKSIPFSQIQDFAKKKPREFHKFYGEWKSTVERLGKAQKFFADKAAFNLGCLLTLLMIIGGVLAMIWGELYLFGAALIIGALLLFFVSPNLYYTAYGADQLAKWSAFRRFLLHFSKMDQSTVPALVVWEHYLVYAVILGVAKQVIDQLAIVFPRMEQDPTFNQTSWSRMNAVQTAMIINNMNTMTRSLNNTVSSASRTASSAIAAASSTSSASSSGGFSSGGGFGGGFSGGGGGGFGGGGGSFR
jgi:uncharacterized membrane protein